MAGKNLGDILLEQGIINKDELNRALQIQGRRLGEILIEEKLADPATIANALKFQARSSGPQRSSRLSVETRALDELLRRLETIEDQLLASSQPELLPAFTSLVSLRQTVEMLLLEPVDTLFQKARWVVNQAATETGKKVELRSMGGGLIIDRSLVEDLSDMMLHLLRNAIDHGIESAADRAMVGKTPSGVIKVAVSALGGRLELEVSDDGRGIDEEKVFLRAQTLGIVKGDRSSISQEQLLRVLFTPGFSTAESVSGLSGRGVGLDVVEAAAIRLGGEVSVGSAPGQGSLFKVSVPLHYARMSVVPLRVGAEWVVVNAVEISSIEARSAAAAHTCGDKALSAAALFGGKPVSKDGVLVRSSGGSSWLFDEVAQPEDVLVREASSFAKGTHGVTGGTRMRNGRSALLVDLGLLSAIGETVEL